MNEKKGARIQRMGEHAVSKMAKDLAKRLGRDPIKFVLPSMRRLAATQLAEAGISVAGPQMTGDWKGANGIHGTCEQSMQ